MPAVNPRIAVTLDPEAYEAVRYLSLASGESMSAIVGELVRASAPVFQRTAEIIAAGKRAREEQREGLRDAAEAAEARLRPIAARVASAVDASLSEFARVVVAGGRPAKRGVPGGPDPRPSNHGGQVKPKRAKGKARRGR